MAAHHIERGRLLLVSRHLVVIRHHGVIVGRHALQVRALRLQRHAGGFKAGPSLIGLATCLLGILPIGQKAEFVNIIVSSLAEGAQRAG